MQLFNSQSNQVHLRGVIGEAGLQKVGDLDVARFTVATEFLYTLSVASSFNVTEWYPCFALVSEQIPDLSIFVKDYEVDLKGRLRFCRFKDSEGEDRPMVYVKVFEAKILGRMGKRLRVRPMKL